MKWPAALVVCLFVTLLARAEETEFPVPPSPPGQIHDDTRFLNESQRTRIGEITKRAKEGGLALYVAFFSFLPGGREKQISETILREWEDESVAALYVATRSGYGPAWTVSPSLTETLPMQRAVQAFSLAENRLEAWQKAAASGSPDYPIDDMIGDLSQTVDAILVGLAEARERDEKSSRGIAWGAAIVVLALLLPVGWIFLRIIRNNPLSTNVSEDSPGFFPPVRVGFRFGAPHGGGSISERKY